MDTLIAAVETALAGLIVGCLAVTAVIVGRSRAPRPVRVVAVLFAVTVAIYAIGSTRIFGGMLGGIPWLRYPLAAWMCGGTAWFGLLVQALFGERPLTWRSGLPVAGLVVLGMAVLNTPAPLRLVLLGVYLVACAVILVRAAVLILGGWSGDLDAARRRLRRQGVLLTLGVILAIVVDLILSSAARVGWLPSWLTVEREAAMAVLAVVVAVQALTLRPIRAERPERDDDEADWLSVSRAMAEEVWREEGLTVALLAVRVDVPEYRLRRVILERSGRRNFPAFVNSFRIAAARARLAEAPGDTVAQVAFEVGFSSLSAFNRAFRETMGEAPVQWRKKLGESSKAQAI